MRKLFVILILLALLSVNQMQCMDYTDKDDIKKDELLEMVIKNFEYDTCSSEQFATAISLVKAGANPNVTFMGESLLHKALIFNNKDLVQV
ncbi:MAG TPA: hypothetical protein VJ201_02015, partial [Candidatus Babeliales bacterium]|nr:hypothetical protein [Candidatus Babeliales bacterium]